MALGDQGKAGAQTKTEEAAKITGEEEAQPKTLSEKARMEAYRFGGFEAVS